MRTILVTGGAGFIGSALVKRLLKDTNNDIVVVDNLLTGHIGKLPKAQDRLRFIKCDVNNRQGIGEIMTTYRFDYVFHYAAMVGVTRTLTHPIDVLNDIQGIKNILELSKNTGVKRVFFSSSSEVYGEPVEFPQNEETTPLNSRLPYAIVKNVGEAFVKSFQQEFGLDYTIFRFFNTYGPYQSKDFVISKFLLAAQQNEDITIYGNGTQTRTFCYIDDNIEATTKIAYDDAFINDVVNIGNSIEIPISDLAQKVIEITNSKSRIVYLDPLKEGDMKRRRPDNSKMLSVLNKDLIKIEDGLKRIYDEGLFEQTH
ncbi:MAG: NAD-dependent epimerase/dehydratase family protein [Bacteroidales bacterium]|nr:NAD-dependent epimerase/dehydratase family protein [Bacteroidales bacterium]